MPSLKYSSLRSPLKFAKGSTAIDRAEPRDGVSLPIGRRQNRTEPTASRATAAAYRAGRRAHQREDGTAGAAVSASPNAPAVGNRSAGVLASALNAARSTAAGRSGRLAPSGGPRSTECRATDFPPPLPRNSGAAPP